MTRRKRGPLRILFGLLMIIGGLAVVAVGIVAVIDERDRIEEEAAARGVLPQALTFDAEAREYRVFVLQGGEDAAVQTACETSSGDRFDGSDQGVSITLGSASSVGTFDAPAGELTVSCGGADGAEFVVTPTGGSILRGILTIIAGAFVAVGGLLLAIWGLVGRRVPV